MTFIFLALFILLAAVSLGLGLFLIFKPSTAIDIQQKFYRLINWNMTPVSIKKEIRNTRIMGMFLITVIILIIAATVISPNLVTAIFGRK